MRVSDSMMYQNMATGIDNAQAAMVKTQGQISSGNRIAQPSDNPSGTAALLRLENALNQTKGWTSAGNTALSQMKTADQTLSSIENAVKSAQSLALQGASATNSAADYQTEAAQVQSILKQVRSLANTRYAGTYIFSGVSQQPPVTGTSFNPASATGGPQNMEIGAGVQVPVTVDGQKVFDTAPTGAPVLPSGNAATLLNTLESLQSDLASGNAAAVEADLGALENQTGGLAAIRADLGATMNRVQAALSTLTQTTTSLQSQEAAIQHIDLAAVASQLAAQQTAYQAAIAAGAQMKLPTLANLLP